MIMYHHALPVLTQRCQDISQLADSSISRTHTDPGRTWLPHRSSRVRRTLLLTTIMVTMDKFSRAVKLILIPALPTALEAVELNFQHLFCYFGIPEDMVSNGAHSLQSMERVYGKIRVRVNERLNIIYEPSAPINKTTGPGTFHGWSMPRILFVTPLLS